MQIVHDKSLIPKSELRTNTEEKQNEVSEEAENQVDTELINVEEEEEGKDIKTDTHCSLACGSCSLVFKDVAEFEVHLESHKKSPAFQCEKCEIIFQTELQREWHTATAHEEGYGK